MPLVKGEPKGDSIQAVRRTHGKSEMWVAILFRKSPVCNNHILWRGTGEETGEPFHHKGTRREKKHLLVGNV